MELIPVSYTHLDVYKRQQLNFRVSAEELAVIEQKMSQFGTSNREAYLRKMALDGYVAVSYTHLRHRLPGKNEIQQVL